MKRGPKPAQGIITTEECCYGCGQVAKFKNHSGSLMCEASSTKCQVNRKNNSNKVKATYDNGRDAKQRYKDLPAAAKQKMNWTKGLTSDNSNGIANQIISRHQSFLEKKWVAHISGVAENPDMRWKRNYIPYIDSEGKSFKLESIHEWKVANELDRNNVHWIRPKPLKLKDGRKYEPDFYLKDFNIYLDPKSLWNEKNNERGQKIRKTQLAQLEKIKLCENEFGVRVLLLMASDKRSFYWSGILEQIVEYLESGDIKADKN